MSRRKRDVPKHARLGMTVESEEPEPGTPAFGLRAERRRRRLQGKRPFSVKYDESLKDRDRRT